MNYSVTVEATENQKAKGKKTNDISYCPNIGSYIYILCRAEGREG